MENNNNYRNKSSNNNIIFGVVPSLLLFSFRCDEDIVLFDDCRWIKFEEDVEEGGERWSKPHVATLSLHSLFELRKSIMTGTVMLDTEATNMAQVSGESLRLCG